MLKCATLDSTPHTLHPTPYTSHPVLNQMGGCEVRLCETLRDLPLLTYKKAHPHKSSSAFIPCMTLDTGSGMPLRLDVSVANVYDY